MFIRHVFMEPQGVPAGTGGAAPVTPPAAPAAPAAPVAPPAPAAAPVYAVPSEVTAQLAQIPALQAALAESNGRWASLGKLFTPADAPPSDPIAAAKETLVVAESALREANVAGLASRLTNGQVHDPMLIARMVGQHPDLAIDLRTRAFANPTGAQAAVQGFIAANPWVSRAPAAAPTGSAPPPVIPTQIPGIPGVPAPAAPPASAGATPAAAMTIADVFSTDLKNLRK